MEEKLIEYKSGWKPVSPIERVFDIRTGSGLHCVWTNKLTKKNASTYMSWKFDWEKLHEQGADTLRGHIIIVSFENLRFAPVKVDIDLIEPGQFVQIHLKNTGQYDTFGVRFEYSLVLCRNSCNNKISCQLGPTDLNDAILIVEGTEFPVNKASLSFHSDYFCALFASKCKNGQPGYYPTQNITVKDFRFLMRIIYGEPETPSDGTVKFFLEVADRFGIPAVTDRVEHHLLHSTNFGNDTVMWLADKHGMLNLLDKCIHKLDTIEKLKKLKESPGFVELSENAQTRVFDRYIELI